MSEVVPGQPGEVDIEQLAAALPGGSVLDEAVLLLKGFAAPTRLKILSLLRTGEVCVHQLVEILEMTQSAVNHQLRTLP